VILAHLVLNKDVVFWLCLLVYGLIVEQYRVVLVIERKVAGSLTAPPVKTLGMLFTRVFVSPSSMICYHPNHRESSVLALFPYIGAALMELCLAQIPLRRISPKLPRGESRGLKQWQIVKFRWKSPTEIMKVADANHLDMSRCLWQVRDKPVCVVLMEFSLLQCTSKVHDFVANTNHGSPLRKSRKSTWFVSRTFVICVRDFVAKSAWCSLGFYTHCDAGSGPWKWRWTLSTWVCYRALRECCWLLALYLNPVYL